MVRRGGPAPLAARDSVLSLLPSLASRSALAARVPRLLPLALLGGAAAFLAFRRMRRAAAAAAFWQTLSRGKLLEGVCPPALADALVREMQRCLDAAELPLSQTHLLRRRHARAACAELQAAGGGEGRGGRAAALRKVAVAASPNFKDVLRARVLASPHFGALQLLCQRLVHHHLLPFLRDGLGEDSFAVQCQPSMRFNLPGCSALGARPGDSDEMIGLHADGEYGHQPGEMNFTLALTPFFGSNGLFVETEPGRGDFREVVMDTGGIFAFAGVSRRHHNKRNTTGVSRVSLDFRVIPMSKYQDSRDGERKASREHRFTLGEYFELVVVGRNNTTVTTGRGLIFRTDEVGSPQRKLQN
ncbi:hypothetical protein AB1Y20_016924 [Prymnesium parvum]|uniref:Uncharacterized protein n=1 Tax=Prymnesium parvum TaxID=97485 RepID=A0AB34ICS6_PRYPA